MCECRTHSQLRYLDGLWCDVVKEMADLPPEKHDLHQQLDGVLLGYDREMRRLRDDVPYYCPNKEVENGSHTRP